MVSSGELALLLATGTDLGLQLELWRIDHVSLDGALIEGPFDGGKILGGESCGQSQRHSDEVDLLGFRVPLGLQGQTQILCIDFASLAEVIDSAALKLTYTNVLPI